MNQIFCKDLLNLIFNYLDIKEFYEIKDYYNVSEKIYLKNVKLCVNKKITLV